MANEYLDLRDLSKELDELRDLLEDAPDEFNENDDNRERLKMLEALNDELNTLESYALDEPSAIRDDYFEEAMRDLAEDCGMIDKDSTMANYIDWERWAEDCKADYICFDFDGSTWWIRSI